MEFRETAVGGEDTAGVMKRRREAMMWAGEKRGKRVIQHRGEKLGAWSVQGSAASEHKVQ